MCYRHHSRPHDLPRNKEPWRVILTTTANFNALNQASNEFAHWRPDFKVAVSPLTVDNGADAGALLLREEVVPGAAAAAVRERHAHALGRRERPALVHAAARALLRRLHADACRRTDHT